MVENTNGGGKQPPRKSFLYYYGLVMLIVMLLNIFLFPSMMDRTQQVRFDQFSDQLKEDNGIKAYEAIDLANELGIDVIVIDHHDYDVPRFMKPLSVSLTDEDFVVIEELLFIDDDMLRLDDPLLKDLDADLDDFLANLLADVK